MSNLASEDVLDQKFAKQEALIRAAWREMACVSGRNPEQVSLPVPEIRSLAPQTKTRHLHHRKAVHLHLWN